MRIRIARPAALFAIPLLIAALAAACGGGDDAATPTGGDSGPVTLRLGYFPNVTHAQPLIGLNDGSFQRELGDGVTIDPKVFNAGPAAIEAMFAGEIDATYIGPNPAINGFQRSDGKEVRIVSGAASGGALFIVRPDANITKPEDLAGKKFATPQLGGTQDVALRAYLKDHGLKPKEQGGNVTIIPTANADALTLFQKGDIDGVWAPEPWATRLVAEAGGKVFLDESSLWPNGQFVTTHLIVTTKFLKQHPDTVEKLVRANVKVTEYINANPDKAKEQVNAAITALTGKGLSKATLDGAWTHVTFTPDPIASSLSKNAQDAYDAGLLGSKKPNLTGIYALETLDKVLKELGQPAVKR